jgi:hypothetical protein
MDRPPPRKHHLSCKTALVALALFEPRRFVEMCVSEDVGVRLGQFWDAIGGGLAPDERRPSTGLSAHVRGPIEAPVVVVAFPPPERSNEAFFVEAVPVDSPQLQFRVFGLEKSLLPKTASRSRSSSSGTATPGTTTAHRRTSAPTTRRSELWLGRSST